LCSLPSGPPDLLQRHTRISNVRFSTPHIPLKKTQHCPLTLLHPVYFHAKTDADEAVFESQTPTIVALTKGCKSAKVVRRVDDVPAGCGSAVLSDMHPRSGASSSTHNPGLANMLTPWACGFFFFGRTQGLMDLDSKIAK
jgi:hypothetical protein